jgi:trk system potassium uptake protein TrkH
VRFDSLGSALERTFHPAQLLALSFAGAVALGTALLMTPAAATGAPLSFVDALFTATSATCVTGLTVVDTGTALTPFGQGVVLALIQLGGLGIMTYSSVFLLALGRRISFRGQALLEETLGRGERTPVRRLVRQVVVFTLAIEAAGALALTAAFAATLPLGEALYQGVFHAVSAFCNAGFSLQADSLTQYRASWPVNLAVLALVVLGGLGFLVLDDLQEGWADWRGGRVVRLRLHSKVVLAGTAGLTAVGAVGIWLFERGNALAGLPRGEAFLACVFQAVTPRTAGFNTLEYASLTDTTLFLTILLMFVGASPGSCAGGIKITTAAVLGALFRARLLGRRRVGLFRRTVPDATVARAVTIAVASFAFATGAIFLLLVSERGAVPHGAAGGAFLEYFFEVVSAFGTVGLSTGTTGTLSPTGRLLITAVMFAGRLGPLTLAVALGMRDERERVWYAEENLMVG